MLKLFRKALVALCAVLFVSTTIKAQDTLPIDPNVTIGKLDNGLTYYIRHNETSKGLADFYIAQKVGSILEEDNQRGLAHFLEHMCFNGTTNFPGSQLRDWLDTKGVKFGADLNAYTSVDETVYNISNVPVGNKSVQDSCLLILHDWANDLTLDPVEIDNERGVIHQEWRRSNKGQMRALEKLLPVIYPNSRYGYRLPIGTMEVVDNFPPQALRDYYETWYRPDQQAIIIVGDIDVDYIEGKIKEMFSSIEMPKNAKERVYFPVDDNEETIYAIGSDTEIPYGIAEIMFKTDAFPNEYKNKAAYLVQHTADQLMAQMLSQRLSDMAKDPDAPFGGAEVDYGNFFLAKTKDALSLSLMAKDNDLLPGIEAVYRELLRAQRGGFTEAEYERAKAEYLSRVEKAYNGRDKVENRQYVNEYVRHFIDNEPIPSIEDEYAIVQQLIPMLPVDFINNNIQDYITDENRVVLVLAPENETFKIPTQEEIAEVMAKVDAEDIAPYEDAMKAEPLIPELPTPGKVLSISDDTQWGAKVLTLSNGLKVYVKPTDFKKDEIIFAASAIGGTSAIGDEFTNELMMMPLAMAQHGLGDYNSTDLERYLKGKQANVILSVDNYNREINGSSTVKDLPTFMELLYMTFVDFTVDTKEFQAIQKQLASVLPNILSQPEVMLQKYMAEVFYTSKAEQLFTVDNINNARLDVITDLIRKQVANAADYTFFFVGDIDMDTFVPLVEQYIATLPADVANSTKGYVPNLGREIKAGSGTDQFTMQMETPQTYAVIRLTGEMEYTPQSRLISSVAGQILTKRLIEKIREEMGATYSISANGSMSRVGERNVEFAIGFPMKPEAKNEVLEAIATIINNMPDDITTEELQPVIEYMVKSYTEMATKNSDWAGAMSATTLNGVDFFNGVTDTLNSITVKDVKDYMRQLIDQNNYRVVILEPEVVEQ